MGALIAPGGRGAFGAPAAGTPVGAGGGVGEFPDSAAVTPSGPLTAASKANAARDRFQFSCIVFMLFPFFRAWGVAQAVHRTTRAAIASGPKILKRPAGQRAGGDHVRASKPTNR
jgi:hypothetical protein